jgi:hypothetical protein
VPAPGWAWWTICVGCIVGCLLLVLAYGCRVGVDRPPVAVDVDRPTIQIAPRAADHRTYDRWLPYAMLAAAVVAWSVPSCWPIRRRR